MWNELSRIRFVQWKFFYFINDEFFIFFLHKVLLKPQSDSDFYLHHDDGRLFLRESRALETETTAACMHWKIINH